MFIFIGVVVLIAAVAGSPAFNVSCQLDVDGQLLMFDYNDKQLSADGKVLLAEWNPDSEDCKFKLFAKFAGGYQYATFVVGPRKNPQKYFRKLDFNKYPGQVSIRGWRCKAGCKGPIDTFDYVIQKDGGPVYATVKEIQPGVIYTVESALCAAAGKPKYMFTYDFSAEGTDTVLNLQMDGDFFFDHQSEMSGVCVYAEP